MARSSQNQLNDTLLRMGIAAPQVIAARTARLCAPGAILSSKNQAEFVRMVSEKQAAAMESYLSLMHSGAVLSQQMFASYLSMFGIGKGSAAFSTDWLSPLNDALKPYRRRVTANARRLSR